MSKTLGSILQVGVGVAAAVFLPGGGLIALGIASNLLRRSPKPEVATTSIKHPTPARISAYGRARPVPMGDWL